VNIYDLSVRCGKLFSLLEIIFDWSDFEIFIFMVNARVVCCSKCIERLFFFFLSEL